MYSYEPGVFKELFFDPILAENIIEIDLWVENGDKISSFKGANDAIGTLILKFEDSDSLDRIMSNYTKYINIVVE